jgi:hypothetical protein
MFTEGRIANGGDLSEPGRTAFRPTCWHSFQVSKVIYVRRIKSDRAVEAL